MTADQTGEYPHVDLVVRLRELAAWAPDDDPDEGFALAADAADEIEYLRAALGYIAAPDDLLDANEGAFNIHAARRMQAQAQAALSTSKEQQT